MWGQVINVAFHSLFWDLKQCFVWVLFCRLLFSSGCLNASGLSLCVYACVHVSVCGHVCFLKIHALPATLSEKYKPWLLSVYRSTSCWFYFLFFLSCSSSSLYCDPRRQGVQTECPWAVWSSQRSSAVFLALFDMGWSLDWTDGIGFGSGRKILFRQASAYACFIYAGFRNPYSRL